MTDGLSRFTSDRRTREESSWTGEEDWAAGTAENVDVVDGNLVSRSASGVGDTPDSGVARWTFDDADMESGEALDAWNDNNATINGATTGATAVYGGESYSFDGTGDYVSAGNPSSLDLTNAISISLWMNSPSSSSNWAKGVSKGHDAAYTLQINHGGNECGSMRVWGSSSAAGAVGSTNIYDGNDHHLVGTYDGSTVAYYIDGELEDSVSAPPSLNSVSDPVWIGRDSHSRSNGGPFRGRIDDPRIYNKGLAETEVQNLYQTGSI
ncbi:MULTISPECIES: LamG domain-containing protein [Haloferacaceae]|uniref:LamG domain-containing protein n=2 Tax=Haloferacaceae TaxID=1644056 RepID=A0ABD6DBY5_9EURY|nr:MULTISPECIES: LamG domain-containing protein [Halorubraceae]